MQIRTNTSVISITPEGFLEVKFIDNDLMIDLDEAKAQYEAAKKLTEGKDMLVLVDARESMHELTKEGKEFIAKVSEKKAEAIVVSELHQRIIATFYLKVTVTIYNHPVKVFNDRNDAVNWLLSMK